MLARAVKGGSPFTVSATCRICNVFWSKATQLLLTKKRSADDNVASSHGFESRSTHFLFLHVGEAGSGLRNDAQVVQEANDHHRTELPFGRRASSGGR